MSTSSGGPATTHVDRESAFRRLFEAVHEGIYIGVLGSGVNPDTTLAANPHLKSLFGYPEATPESEIRPFALVRFADPESRDRLLDRLAADGMVKDYVVRLRRADASEMLVALTARGDAHDASGGMAVEVLVCEIADEFERLSDGARAEAHAERMASLGQTVSGVAHELNNPLTTIIGWAERLMDRPLDARSRLGLETILAEAKRASRVVRNLLMFSRKRESTRTLVDVNQIVEQALALRSHDHHRVRIEVSTTLSPALPLVFGDGHQIQQVLLNLVINAEQSMVTANARGSLVLKTWHDAENDLVTVAVTDDGPGVPPHVRSRIFDPFFTTKDAGAGTGLGLTVARAIAREHGGDIRLDAEARAGASFTLTLPGAPKRP